MDGDTIDVRRSDGTLIRIRVHGIDCPERGKPFSNVARNFTRSMVFGQDIRVTPRDTDRYGRLVAQVRVGERDLSEALVEAGLAWQFRRYSDDARLASLEQAAREAKRSLWQLGGDPHGVRDTVRRPLVADPDASAEAVELHGNVNSRLYHRPSCRNYSCKNCTRVFSSEQAAEASGFKAAKDCNF
ncbi:thermonuclease family protein [Luteitalea pratensis]|uniref:thermonuclease family protein n=1 Tax=Luteitalea pratensis TaxID=1855912 RepID=UPI0012FF88AC|nr:thermonuclease family protein [Luteitalea pratensis]